MTIIYIYYVCMLNNQYEYSVYNKVYILYIKINFFKLIIHFFVHYIIIWEPKNKRLLYMGDILIKRHL